jgi:hypothetical protein
MWAGFYILRFMLHLQPCWNYAAFLRVMMRQQQAQAIWPIVKHRHYVLMGKTVLQLTGQDDKCKSCTDYKWNGIKWIYMDHMSGTTGIKVSHQIPTALAQILFQVRSCAICGGQSGTEAGFLQVLQFSLPIPTPRSPPHSLITLSSL